MSSKQYIRGDHRSNQMSTLDDFQVNGNKLPTNLSNSYSRSSEVHILGLSSKDYNGHSLHLKNCMIGGCK